MFKEFIMNYFSRAIDVIERIDQQAFEKALQLIRDKWLNEKQIICFGNGGSALTAQHYVTDWSKCVYLCTGKPLHARCLADNMGVITAYANDLDFNDIFVAQLKPILKPGDLVIGISGSGNSENVLRAIDYANRNGGTTIGVCGFDGGKLKNLAQHAVWAPVDDMQLSEDIHFIFGHLVTQALCEKNCSRSL
jgi:D-sedoheptulose 7-phosphate isomerase